MGSLSKDDRLAQIRGILDLWQAMRADTYIRNGAIKDGQRENGLIDAVIEAALPEIVAVVLEDRVARVFCNLWYVVHHYSNDSPDLISVEGDYTAVREGIRSAADNFVNNRGKPVSEYIKNSVAVEFARHRDKHIAAVRRKRPEELLPVVLGWRRPNAAVLLEHLTFEQRGALLELLFARVDRSLVVPLEDEPEDELLWRIWYTGVLQAQDSKLREVLQKKDDRAVFVLGGSSRQRLPKGVNPAGPMHARFYEQWAKELKLAGRPIKDPESKSRIARLTGLDRRTVAHYLASDVQVGVSLDEEGHPRWRFRLKEVQRSIEVARRKKRGRKAKRS